MAEPIKGEVIGVLPSIELPHNKQVDLSKSFSSQANTSLGKVNGASVVSRPRPPAGIMNKKKLASEEKPILKSIASDVSPSKDAQKPIESKEKAGETKDQKIANLEAENRSLLSKIEHLSIAPHSLVSDKAAADNKSSAEISLERARLDLKVADTVHLGQNEQRIKNGAEAARDFVKSEISAVEREINNAKNALYDLEKTEYMQNQKMAADMMSKMESIIGQRSQALMQFAQITSSALSQIK